MIRRKRYTYKPHTPQHVADNVLNRDFQSDYDAMEVLLTDVTEFKYGSHSKAYLSAILDYGANKIVAYKLSTRNNINWCMTQLLKLRRQFYGIRHSYTVIVVFNIHRISVNYSPLSYA